MDPKTPAFKITDKKLGRGLSALLGENKIQSNILNTNNENIEKIEKINLNKITIGNYQPRTNFDETELVELANSIKEHGVIQPIIVRKNNDDTYQIIAGERRFRASQIANLREIPAIVKKFSNQDALEIAIIENIQRTDLSVTEEASGYQKLIEEFSYTQDQIAQKVGKSRSHITNLLRLLNLPQKVRDLLDAKLISMGHARAIINAEDPSRLADIIINENLNVRQAEDLARHQKITNNKINDLEAIQDSPVSIRTESRIKFVNNDYLSNLEKEFLKVLGVECKILFNPLKNSGKITIKFEEIETIKDILAKININD